EKGGLNQYAYVANGPIGGLDPLGLAFTGHWYGFVSSTLTINGTTYHIPSKAEFVSAIIQAAEKDGWITSFVYSGHTAPDTGQLKLGGNKGDQDQTGQAYRNEINYSQLVTILEGLQDYFDPNVIKEINS